MASLQIENAHLKQTYKDLFESVQSSRVENIQCDEVKIKIDFEKIETQNIELEHQLEKILAKQTKENSDLLRKIDNLDNAFANEVKRLTTGKLTAFDKENCAFGSKVTHFRKIIAQKTKDFDDVKLELSNKTAKFEAYFEKLKIRKLFSNDN
ncbi:hypothetical protein Tco_0510607 [Tanacetum coccineum]